MKLTNSVAMITGAASGIGRATAALFAAEGATLVLTDIDGERLAGNGLPADGNGWLHRADVSRAADVDGLVAGALQRFGRIDILCNVAGRSTFGDLLSTTEAAWDDILASNLKSVFLCSKAVLPGMVERQRGVVVNMGSVWGLAAGSFAAAYCASKGAIIALTRSMAIDYAKYGIRVNALCPGGVETPMIDRYADALPNVSATAARNFLKSAHPLGRLAEPDEIARAALFLACEDSSFMTGSHLVVDGGFLAR
jgi:meso-butanediol dehydrogenase / (S,S)-butanediol dehydrogenase / diacetyl reductase